MAARTILLLKCFVPQSPGVEYFHSGEFRNRYPSVLQESLGGLIVNGLIHFIRGHVESVDRQKLRLHPRRKDPGAGLTADARDRTAAQDAMNMDRTAGHQLRPRGHGADHHDIAVEMHDALPRADGAVEEKGFRFTGRIVIGPVTGSAASCLVARRIVSVRVASVPGRSGSVGGKLDGAARASSVELDRPVPPCECGPVRMGPLDADDMNAAFDQSLLQPRQIGGLLGNQAEIQNDRPPREEAHRVRDLVIEPSHPVGQGGLRRENERQKRTAPRPDTHRRIGGLQAGSGIGSRDGSSPCRGCGGGCCGRIDNGFDNVI